MYTRRTNNKEANMADDDNKRVRSAPSAVKHDAALPSGMKKISPDKIGEFQLRGPEDDVGELVSGCVVCRGRTVHIPTGKKVPIGSTPMPVTSADGLRTFATVTTSATRAYGPGETLPPIPAADAARMRALGSVLPLDGIPCAASVLNAAPQAMR